MIDCVFYGIRFLRSPTLLLALVQMEIDRLCALDRPR